MVSEIVKSYQNCGWEAYIYYYRDKDILLEDSGKLYPMEIRKTTTPQKQLTRVFGVIDKIPSLHTLPSYSSERKLIL